jgi:hypothetical protein
MTTNLPPGPFSARSDGNASYIHDADKTFVGYFRGAGPPQARALADLLIRAEREADPTPLNADWLLSVGGEGSVEYKGIYDVLFDHPDFEVVMEFRPRYGNVPHMVLRETYEMVSKIRISVPTRGAFRTAMRMLGIKLTETP